MSATHYPQSQTSATSPVTTPRRIRKHFGEQGGLRVGCSGFFPSSGTQVDRFIPEPKGGTDHISNLQLLCGGCNATKMNRPMSYLTAKKLAGLGITYSGKITAIVKAAEAEQAKEAEAAAPDALKTLLTEVGLDAGEATLLLVAAVKAMAEYEVKENSDDR